MKCKECRTSSTAQQFQASSAHELHHGPRKRYSLPQLKLMRTHTQMPHASLSKAGKEMGGGIKESDTLIN